MLHAARWWKRCTKIVVPVARILLLLFPAGLEELCTAVAAAAAATASAAHEYNYLVAHRALLPGECGIVV